MINFECKFECATRQDAICALQEVIERIEEDYLCGLLYSAEGDWSCSGEEEPDLD